MNYNSVTIYSLSGCFELFINNFTKIGVDLFLMLSGALLLGKNEELSLFLKKRLPRIIKPFLFWAFISSLMLILASYFIPNVKFIDNFNVITILTFFYNTVMADAPGSAVYWFFWMMLGVYLTIPILNKWISNSDLKEVEYFLLLWIIVTIFEYTLMVKFPVKLTYFTSPFALVVLGYYLRHTDRKIFNNKLIAVILIIISSLAMLVYSYMVADSQILFSFNRYSIPVILEVVGVFCLFKEIKPPKIKIQKYITSISVCSYGIYLIHNQILLTLRRILPFDNLGFAGSYLLLFLISFLLSWFIIYILSRISIFNEFIKVK